MRLAFIDQNRRGKRPHMARRPKNPDRTYSVVLDEFETARAKADELKEASKEANARAAKLKAEANRLKNRAVAQAEKRLAEAKAELERVTNLIAED
ncbi:hypothetical protein F8O07_06645 [Pseudoclavibacter sp. CFCC 13796]|uniref:hypothetical protein n=1 Tax=Pseudoclavibacter sp. CFCC 13796 TaxID=2615179 RepID=UPI0013018380|nr:hypothetical protein [Pseudoclavibacter sp. CFCC 13796]KAB1661577.1 hypothetical protein F8O07_06645 [Pseudoclavibacter sp. CFCC 13796]